MNELEIELLLHIGECVYALLCLPEADDVEGGGALRLELRYRLDELKGDLDGYVR